MVVLSVALLSLLSVLRVLLVKLCVVLGQSRVWSCLAFILLGTCWSLLRLMKAWCAALYINEAYMIAPCDGSRETLPVHDAISVVRIIEVQVPLM